MEGDQVFSFGHSESKVHVRHVRGGPSGPWVHKTGIEIVVAVTAGKGVSA